MVGAPEADQDAGVAHLLLAPLGGQMSLEDAHARLSGVDVHGHVGASIAIDGDNNGDGFADAVIGAPYTYTGPDGPEGAFVVHGPLAGEIDLANAIFLAGEHRGDGGGTSVAFAGDVDADGYDDILIGAPDYDTTDLFSLWHLGRVYLFRGPVLSGGNLADADATITGSDAWSPLHNPMEDGEYAGWSVAGAGDLDGDGLDDVAVGRPGLGYYAEYGGVFVAYGPVDQAVADCRMYCSAGCWRAGQSVASAGDVNGDGLDDLLIGAATWGAPYDETYSEAVYLFYGPIGEEEVIEDADAIFTDPYGRGSYSVSSAGDLDGDGLDDILIGNPQYSVDWTYQGAAYVIFGGGLWQ